MYVYINGSCCCYQYTITSDSNHGADSNGDEMKPGEIQYNFTADSDHGASSDADQMELEENEVRATPYVNTTENISHSLQSIGLYVNINSCYICH